MDHVYNAVIRNEMTSTVNDGPLKFYNAMLGRLIHVNQKVNNNITCIRDVEICFLRSLAGSKRG
jgi:hypothetical protein